MRCAGSLSFYVIWGKKVQTIPLKDKTCSFFEFILCLWTIAAHTDSVSLPVLQLLHSQHRRWSSRPPCFSRTAKPSRGLLPWAQTPIHTWPAASTYSSCGSLGFCLAFPLHAPLLSSVYHALFLEQDEYFPGFSVCYFVLCLASVYCAF